jgi:hypothetical protein
MATRPQCRGCGKRVFTETEVINFDADGGAWHPDCLEKAYGNDPLPPNDDGSFTGTLNDMA